MTNDRHRGNRNNDSNRNASGGQQGSRRRSSGSRSPGGRPGGNRSGGGRNTPDRPRRGGAPQGGSSRPPRHGPAAASGRPGAQDQGAVSLIQAQTLNLTLSAWNMSRTRVEKPDTARDHVADLVAGWLQDRGA